MIISGIVKTIDFENKKAVHIEVLINKVISICYDGQNLIEDTDSKFIHTSTENKNTHRTINKEFLNEHLDFFQNIAKHKIVGFIRKHDVSNIIL